MVDYASLIRPTSGAYSAASRCGSAFSTRAAQNLNSGILPNGSSAGLVSRFAAASTIGERDEHDAVRHRVVLPRVQFDRAAPRRDAHHVAGLDAELGDGAARQRRRSAPGSSASSTRRAARHRAGVPMLELAAGGEDERIFVRPASRPAAAASPRRACRSRPAAGSPCRTRRRGRACPAHRTDRSPRSSRSTRSQEMLSSDGISDAISVIDLARTCL